MKPKLLIVIILVGGILCGSTAGAFLALTQDLPQIRSLESYQPPTVTRIYSADRILLAELFLEKRDPVSLNAIPKELQIALVTTEDRSFFRHSGIDLKGILRAIVKDILAGEFVEGASTITQQLAKTLFLTPRKTIVRKIKEAILAFQLERRYTKDEILALYLNEVYFGSGAYGVKSAAQIFFGKQIGDLTLAECALVAAMPKSPSRFSPLVNPELATKRRNIVLKQMLQTDSINADQYRQASQEPLSLNTGQEKSIKAPYFIDYIKKSLEDAVGATLLYKGGLVVTTTLYYQHQQTAEQAVANGLVKLENRMQSNGRADDNPQGALIALDIQTGGILAMVGGKDYYTSAFNRAVSAKRQPGSAFKPFLYGQAIERGFAQNDMLLDAPVVFKGAIAGQDWMPQNFSKKYTGEVTMRDALARSKNIPAVRLAEKLSPSAIARFAQSLGIESSLELNLSLALGTSEVNLLELTAAYAVFANKGQWVKPYGVTEVRDHNDRLIWRVRPQRKAVMSRAGAAVMVNMLEAVINEGTGKKATVLQRSIAGKTGTTNEYRDALFVGFSPEIATGVWVGLDNAASLGPRETGARAALPIWIDYMATSLLEKPYQYFDFPDDVIRRPIDRATGKPVPAQSPTAVAALFKVGTEPDG